MAGCGERSTKWKITFLKGLRGRFEMVRMMFHMADFEYESEDIDFDVWPQIKPSESMS